MKNNRPVFYANFICHFGTQELLHYFEQIVAPAFLTSRSRKYKDAAYFFHDVKIINLGTQDQPEWAIGGNFVKSMIVRSEQRYDQETNTLQRANEIMATAPSSIFVLLLRNHKLIYMLKTRNAPSIDSFRSTALHFITMARLDFINQLYEIAKKDRGRFPEEILETQKDVEGKIAKITKKKLQEIIDVPQLNIVPLANEDSLREFIKKFKILRSASVQLIKPNSEIDNDDFFEKFRNKSKDVGAIKSAIVYRNKDGLKKAQVAAQLDVAAKDGNSQIQLNGIDANDQNLRGSNDEFKIISYIKFVDQPLSLTISQLNHLFKKQVKNGAIKLPQRSPNPKLERKFFESIARMKKESNDDKT